MKRPPAVRLLLVAVLAVAIGVLGSATDEVPFDWYTQGRTFLIGTLRLIDIMTNSAPAWATIAVLAGALSPTKAWAALVGCASLVAMAVGYYVYGLTVGDRSTLGFTAILPTMTRWLVIAVVTGVIGGLVGNLLHTRRRPAALTGLALAWLAYAIYLPLSLADLPMTLAQIIHIATAAAIATAARRGYRALRHEQ